MILSKSIFLLLMTQNVEPLRIGFRHIIVDSSSTTSGALTRTCLESETLASFTTLYVSSTSSSMSSSSSVSSSSLPWHWFLSRSPSRLCTLKRDSRHGCERSRTHRLRPWLSRSRTRRGCKMLPLKITQFFL